MSLQIPQLRLVIIKIEGAYKKKSAGICTCHSSHASRPSHCPLSKNEQRRSPRRYHQGLQYTPRRHLPLPCSLTEFKSCEVLMRQRQKPSSKRLSHIYVCPHPRRERCKDTDLFRNHNSFS